MLQTNFHQSRRLHTPELVRHTLPTIHQHQRDRSAAPSAKSRSGGPQSTSKHSLLRRLQEGPLTYSRSPPSQQQGQEETRQAAPVRQLRPPQPHQQGLPATPRELPARGPRHAAGPVRPPGLREHVRAEGRAVQAPAGPARRAQESETAKTARSLTYLRYNRPNQCKKRA